MPRIKVCVELGGAIQVLLCRHSHLGRIFYPLQYRAQDRNTCEHQSLETALELTIAVTIYHNPGLDLSNVPGWVPRSRFWHFFSNVLHTMVAIGIIASTSTENRRFRYQMLALFQERIVPEYAFLEPRGMGIFDGKEAAAILPEVRSHGCV